VNCAKMAVLIEMPSGMRTRVGSRKHVLDGGEHSRHLANMIEPSMCGGPLVIRPFVHLSSDD